MKPFRLSRRAMLLGAGVGVALPVLDAMLNDRGLLHGTADAQTRTMPLRLFTFFFPGGCDLMNWHPTATGANYELTDSLMPLAAHKSSITVVSGVNLAVNNGESLAPAQRFLDRIEVQLTDYGYDPTAQIVKKYQVTGLPVSYFIDADGVITRVVTGELSFNVMESAVQEVIAGYKALAQ